MVLPRRAQVNYRAGSVVIFKLCRFTLDWIAKRIAEARTAVPVGASVAARLQQELAERMRERAFRNLELADLARDLLSAAEPPLAKDAP
jgi:hypothetical protein